MFDVVLFDLMGTVIYDPYLEAIEAATGMPVSAAAAARNPSAWPLFEAGVIDEAEFARQFFSENTSGHRLDLDAFHKVRLEGYRFLPGMPELLGSLEGRARRYVASNYPVWIDDMGVTLQFERFFEGVYASCHLGVRKPDTAFFSAIIDDLGVTAGQCLFVDDRQVNCDAAAAVGMSVHTFDGATSLTERLRAEGLVS